MKINDNTGLKFMPSFNNFPQFVLLWYRKYRKNNKQIYKEAQGAQGQGTN